MVWEREGGGGKRKERKGAGGGWYSAGQRPELWDVRRGVREEGWEVWSELLGPGSEKAWSRAVA